MNISKRAIISLACGLGATAAFAGGPALSWTSSGFNSASVTSTRGYSFNVLDAAGIDVTALTFFDEGADGLAESHDVGIWDSAGNLLVSANVSSGVVDAIDVNGLFRVKSISTFHLAQGTDYVVGGVFLAGSADRQAINFVGLTTGPEISYGQTRFNNNGVNALSFATSTISQSGLPGGSFEYASAVPEPASIAAIGLGIVCLLRKRKSK